MTAAVFRPILERFPGLARLPLIELASLPTPVLRVDISADRHVGARAPLYVKCDDRTSPRYGGNKVRKLEWLLAEAKHSGCDSVLTVGGLGTNHGLATAIFARECGLRCHLALFGQPITAHVRQQIKLFHYYGATIHHPRGIGGIAAYTAGKLLKSLLKLDGEKIRFIPGGGSNGLGALGFVNAAFELKAQIDAGELPEPGAIIVATGSSGTLAGLTLGARLAGLNARVIGIRVTPKIVANRKLVAHLMNESLKLIRSQGDDAPQFSFGAGDVEINHAYYGGEYGRVTEAGLAAQTLAAEHGIKLETTYTAKAFAAALDYVDSHGPDEPVLFWNTFNSVDLSAQAESVSVADLPPEFQRYF